MMFMASEGDNASSESREVAITHVTLIQRRRGSEDDEDFQKFRGH